MLNRNTADKLLGSFGDTRILVVGDLMLDRYVFGSVSRISQERYQPANRTAVTDADGKNEIAIIRINVSRNLVFVRLEKRFDFLRDFADSDHKASLPVNIGFHSVYRLERPFLLGHSIHKTCHHRSV